MSLPSRRVRLPLPLSPPLLLCALAVFTWLPVGCARGPMVLPAAEQKPIDRSIVEYPGGYELAPVVRNLTAPSAIAFDSEGSQACESQGFEGDGHRRQRSAGHCVTH